MIFAPLRDLGQYSGTIPLPDAVFGFIGRASSLGDGKHPIDGDRVFASIETYKTRDFRSASFEFHRKYFDVQFLLSGRERIYTFPMNGEEPLSVPYSQERDIGFYPPPKDFVSIDLVPGYFAFFSFSDGHMPSISAGNGGIVRKCVIKIKP